MELEFNVIQDPGGVREYSTGFIQPEAVNWFPAEPGRYLCI